MAVKFIVVHDSCIMDSLQFWGVIVAVVAVVAVVTISGGGNLTVMFSYEEALVHAICFIIIVN